MVGDGCFLPFRRFEMCPALHGTWLASWCRLMPRSLISRSSITAKSLMRLTHRV